MYSGQRNVWTPIFFCYYNMQDRFTGYDKYCPGNISFYCFLFQNLLESCYHMRMGYGIWDSVQKNDRRKQCLI